MNWFDFGTGFATCFTIWWALETYKDPNFKKNLYKIRHGEDSPE
jgi:hypothetical protein